MPSPGKVITVATADIAGLHAAANEAACGDIIEIPASFKFHFTTYSWELPAKACDANHWITVRSSAYAQLPSQGTRVTPCYAGVASLPNRPVYPCPTPVNAMPKLYVDKAGPVIKFAAGANYYHIMGLELTRTIGTGLVYNLVLANGTDHVVFDRNWVHGSSRTDETTRGIYISDTTHLAVVNSYFNDFKCIELKQPTCTDAQTVAGGDGVATVEGPWKIYNNFLEAAAEGTLFGGSSKGTTSPADIEMRLNHFYKNPSWNPKSPNFVPPMTGSPGYIVKNMVEFKNATRVLFEGNFGEYSWGGFSQVGWAMVFTPSGTWAQVVDITVRYNKFSHEGSGFQLAATIFSKPGVVPVVDSKAAYNWSIHDVVVDDMNAQYYTGAGQAAQISSGFVHNTPLHNVTLNHLTVFNYALPNYPKYVPGNIFDVGAQDTNPLPTMNNIAITNSIFRATEYNIWSVGGANNVCPVGSNPIETFVRCFGNYKVTNNVIAGYDDPAYAIQKRGPWPTGNWPTSDPTGTVDSIGFVNFNGGDGGDYHLQPSSRYHHAATDGKDLGANIDSVNSATRIAE